MSVESAVGPESGPDLDHNIGLVVERVTGTVTRLRSDGVDPDVIRALVEQEWQRFASARVQHFIPLLVHRAVVERLTSGPPLDQRVG